MVVNQAPELLRGSLRLVLTLESIYSFDLFLRDVKQAFVQSSDPLNRELYISPKRHPSVLELMGYPPNYMLKAHKPLYGLSESPGYWWVTFKRYHIEDLGMFQSVMDLCLFFRKNNGKLQGFSGVLVDDTIRAGDEDFVNLEISASSRFDVKPKETDFPLKFAGVFISEVDINGTPALHCHQIPYAQEIKLLNPATISNPDFWKTFAHVQGQLVYVATSTRPDFAFVSA